jgi:hypothetical protein
MRMRLSLSSRRSLIPSSLRSRTSSAMYSMRRALLTWYGISVTTIGSPRRPRAPRSAPRADHHRAAPRLVRLADPLAPVDHAPGGEVRPAHEGLQARCWSASGLSIRWMHAPPPPAGCAGGCWSAIPTAIPLEPLTRGWGRAPAARAAPPAGRRSWARSRPSPCRCRPAARWPAEPGRASGVAVGRRAVAVDGAEVPLPVHQRVAQGEVLHHAHERVVHRAVAVRVVLAQHVADHRGALAVRAVGGEPRLVHGEEDAAVHRLQPVAHVGKGALHDDAHRIVDERLAHLVLDQPRKDLGSAGGLLRELARFGRGDVVGHLQRAWKLVSVGRSHRYGTRR